MSKVAVERLKTTLSPSHDRVLIRPFIPNDPNRCFRIIGRVMTLSDEAVARALAAVLSEFKEHHPDIERMLLGNYDRVRQWSLTDLPISEERKMLIGSYFTQEYSLESAALFNPSIVPHPEQSGVPEGCIRFIMSLRATGEGHISSIVFREGMITEDYQIKLRRPTPYVTEPDRSSHYFEKQLFARKLAELDLDNSFSREALRELGESFSLDELRLRIEDLRRKSASAGDARYTAEAVMTLAYSNYEVTFGPEKRTSEKVIFPSSPSQSNGIEDARFVLFADEGGERTYYGTYTAYDGKTILPQLIETSDFSTFKFITLNGPAAKNKGMALFPRKIGGSYAMISRQDNENIYIMFSDNIHFWYDPRIIMRPTYSWEYVQLGNCGSPIETEAGWLVLSHGVGPMRKYCIGAFLLDREDPTRVIGRLTEPLIEPDENEREGYVPNVVYTCGALSFGGKLIIPYAMSDYATRFAIADLGEILNAMDRG